jgi:hypothetical protein
MGLFPRFTSTRSSFLPSGTEVSSIHLNEPVDNQNEGSATKFVHSNNYEDVALHLSPAELDAQSSASTAE